MSDTINIQHSKLEVVFITSIIFSHIVYHISHQFLPGKIHRVRICRVRFCVTQYSYDRHLIITDFLFVEVTEFLLMSKPVTHVTFNGRVESAIATNVTTFTTVITPRRLAMGGCYSSI